MSQQSPDDDEETTILARLSDATEAGALRELLASEGIAVSTPGLTHRGMFGMAGGFVEIIVRVPNKDRERARELLEGLRTASPTDEAKTAPEDRMRTDRLRRVAVFAAFIVPGGGHFYARRWGPGFALLAMQVAAIGLAVVFPLFWYAVPGIALADAIGAVRAVGGDQRGQKPTLAFAPVLGLIALLAVPSVRYAAPSLVAGSAMVRACARVAACDERQTEAACIDGAAGRAFAGHESQRDGACAECLEAATCVGAYDACTICDGLVTVPRIDDTAAGPLGTRPEDLVHVVPSLFAPPDREGPSDVELEEMLRTLDDLPPPTASSPAHP